MRTHSRHAQLRNTGIASPVYPGTFTPRAGRRPILELFAFLTVMALAGFGYTVFKLWQHTGGEARDTLVYINQQLAQSTRATFIKQETVLRVVGEQLLRLGTLNHPEAGRTIIEDVALIDPGMVGFGLIDPDGQLLIASGVASDKPLPNLLQHEETAESFREALDSPILQVGRPWFMRPFNDWVVPIRKTIRDGHRKPIAVMAAGYRIAGGTTTWAKLELPDDIGVGVLREDGYFQYVHFVTGGEPGPERLREIYGSPTGSGVLEQIKRDGRDRGLIHLDKSFTSENLLATYTYLPEYGIYTVVSLPESTITRAFIAVLAGPASLVSLYLVLAFIAYRFAVRSQREHETRLTHLAHHDALTGLPNRVLMRDRLDQALRTAQRDDHRVALFFIDIDRFKEINDAHGHAQGDALLQQIAARLLAVVRPGDTVARLGGDEFVVILPDIADREVIEALAERVNTQFLTPIVIDSVEHHVTTSIGIAVFPDDSITVDEIQKHSDVALFEAKDRGRACHVYFDAELNSRAQRHADLRDALRLAIDNRQLSLTYQPQLDSASERVVAVEALLRWHSPQHGTVAPEEFIALAEESGMIGEIGHFALRQAMSDIGQVNELLGLDLKVAVNISAAQMLGDSLSAFVRRETVARSFACRNLVLELTESTLIEEFERVSTELEALRRMGVGIAIDDFGTGYSSLSYLNRLPVTELKIDRSFVRDIGHKSDDRTLIASIIGLGHGQGMCLVAEGVENPEQARLLSELGCDALQGSHFSPPLTLDGLRDYLRRTVPVSDQAPHAPL